MIIKCPECGHAVSTNAEYCPNCGNPQLQKDDCMKGTTEIESPFDTVTPQKQKNTTICPTCNSVISKRVKRCPHCGEKNKRPLKYRPKLIFLLVVVCLIVGLKGFSYIKSNVYSEPDYYPVLDFSELLQDCKKDFQSAQEKYVGSYIEITDPNTRSPSYFQIYYDMTEVSNGTIYKYQADLKVNANYKSNKAKKSMPKNPTSEYMSITVQGKITGLSYYSITNSVSISMDVYNSHVN